uniref:Uncharacterized protein n=1 Tax=Cannabis sativa TaxID=3483 RepID=A0A803NY95_CANSA
MDEISEVISMPGEKMPKLIISVLETFGCVMKGILASSEGYTEIKSFTGFLRIMCANITVVGDGRINEAVYKGLRRRVIGIAMQNPGILEWSSCIVAGLSTGCGYEDDVGFANETIVHSLIVCLVVESLDVV